MAVLVPIILYALVYVIRVSPAALKDYMTQMFGINMMQFGIFSSCSYWSYTPMQLFAGPLIDHFGPKISILVSCLLITLGMLLVAYSDHFYVVIIAFILMGIGSAFAFPTVMKVASDIFPKKVTLIAGFATCIGVSGAIAGQTILYRGLHYFGHVIMSSFSIVICAVLSFITWNFFYSEHSSQKTTSTIQDIMIDTQHVLTRKSVILSGLVGMCYLMPINTFASVWAISYFEQVHVLEPNAAADASTYIYYGWMIGCLSVDRVCRYASKTVVMSLGGILASITFTALVYFSFKTHLHVQILLILTGFFLGCQVLIFSLSAEAVSPKHTATAICCTNMLCMLSGFMQPLIGYILDLYWDGTIINEIKIFSEAGFQNALLIIPAFLIIGSMLSLQIKDSAPHQLHATQDTD